MSTRSFVGYKTDNVQKGTYVHWDGHIHSVGKTLYEFWQDRNKVIEMVNTGGIRSLLGAKSIDEVEYFEKDYRYPLTVEGDFFVFAQNTGWFNYAYLLTPKGWLAQDFYSEDGVQPLATMIEKF